jgi:two-component system nitrogen regulation response regulator GlnG
MAGTVLFVGTDDAAAAQVARACDAVGAAHVRCGDADEAAAALGAGGVDLVVCGYDAFEALSGDRPDLAAVLITDHADSEQTIESMKRGALDCLVRPLSDEQLARAVERALGVVREAPRPKKRGGKATRPLGTKLVGQSPAMQEVYKLIGLVAPSEINVLITGESGTGKELVARAIQEHSRRADKPFLEVNCAAIPETLLESELFGHEKGAFTGADAQRIGKFEQCHNGTLFLDEVGDIPLATQAKLLRVLQDRTFQRLGSNKVIRCDVRIISATHQPLTQLIGEKRFREDLFYRLKVATIHVPPLRQREVDAVLLAHYFIDRLQQEHGSRVTHFAPEVVKMLLTYPWPGNVRELENVIKSAVVLSRGPVLRPEALPGHVARGGVEGDPGEPAAEAGAPAAADPLSELARRLVGDASKRGRVHAEAVGAMERAVIEAALNAADGHLTAAAQRLGISRTTLRKKMRELGVAVASRVVEGS